MASIEGETTRGRVYGRPEASPNRPGSGPAGPRTRPPARSRPARGPCAPEHAPPERRVSDRIGAIAESATLAVDAKAKALKAAGRPVIGFGAGEPDFPTPDYIVEAAVDACRDPREPPLHARRRPARAQAGDRGEDACATPATRSTPAQVLVTNGGKQAIYEAFADAARPGRRGAAAGAVLDDLPGGDPARRRRARAGADRRDDRTTWSPSSSSRRPAPSAPRCCCSCSPSNPTGAVYPPDEVEAIGRWAVEHGLWVVTDEIYEHLVVRRRRARLDAGRGARAGRPLRRGQRRREDVRDDRLAGRLDDRPGRRRSRRRPTCSPTRPRNVANVSQRAALAAVSGDLTAVARDAGGLRPAPADDRADAATRSPGVDCPEPQGAFYAYPSVKGCSARSCAAARRPRPRPSWPS